MYLPRCYYTPGEYFFLYFVFVILMQDISHDLETWWHTVDQSEREREGESERGQGCVIVIEKWELCVLYQSWAGFAVLSGSPCVVPFLSGTAQRSGLLAALFSLAHKFRVCASSVLYVCKCCQRKTRAGPRTHMCIYKRTQIIFIGVQKQHITGSLLHTYMHRYKNFRPVQSTFFFFFFLLPGVYKFILCAEEGD